MTQSTEEPTPAPEPAPAPAPEPEPTIHPGGAIVGDGPPPADVGQLAQRLAALESRVATLEQHGEQQHGEQHEQHASGGRRKAD